MAIEKQLEEFGLSEKEAVLYLATLELGPSTITDIAKISGVNRATSYLIMDGLKTKGLVSISLKKKRKLYVAASPDKFEDLIDQKKALFKKILPQLLAFETVPGKKPKVQFYEGEQAIASVHRESLDATTDILSISGGKPFSNIILKYTPDWVERRIKNKIPLRLLGPDIPENVAWKEKDAQQLRQTKLIPHDQYSFKINIDIYNNRVFIYSGDEKIALLIESKDIADTMRSFFNLTWGLLR
jgi:sugar-specific transcriptional regulator TrmB